MKKVLAILAFVLVAIDGPADGILSTPVAAADGRAVTDGAADSAGSRVDGVATEARVSRADLLTLSATTAVNTGIEFVGDPLQILLLHPSAEAGVPSPPDGSAKARPEEKPAARGPAAHRSRHRG